MTKSDKRAVDASKKRRKKEFFALLLAFGWRHHSLTRGAMQKGVVQADAIAGNNNAINNKRASGVPAGRRLQPCPKRTDNSLIKPWQ
jgi:hypothetical protein